MRPTRGITPTAESWLRTGSALGALLVLAAAPLTALAAPARTVVVNCARGGRISDALDKNPGPLVVEVRGICRENVRIERNDLTLRGRDPATDCRLEDNVPFGAGARLGAVLNLSCRISGRKGVAADSGAHVEVFCEPGFAGSTCGIDVTEEAVSAHGEGTTAELVDVAFRGRMMAFGGARIGVWGGVQDLPSGLLPNIFSESAWLSTGAAESGATTSLAATRLSIFSRAALYGGTVLQDGLWCSTGADAWSEDPLPAVQVSGCEHVPIQETTLP